MKTYATNQSAAVLSSPPPRSRASAKPSRKQRELKLFGEWLAGSAEAGQALFAAHFDDIYRFFHNKCAAETDDLVQRTFLACIKSKRRFRAESSFRTFLFSIARHELYGFLRRKRNTAERVDFGVTSLAEITTTQRTKLGRKSEAQSLRAAMETLSVDEQVLLELRYWHELDATALGEIFEAPPATIRTRLRRARLALQSLLESPLPPRA